MKKIEDEKDVVDGKIFSQGETDLSSVKYILYRFKGGESVRIYNPVAVIDTGTVHRISDNKGQLHVVPGTWIHLKICSEDGTTSSYKNFFKDFEGALLTEKKEEK